MPSMGSKGFIPDTEFYHRQLKTEDMLPYSLPLFLMQTIILVNIHNSVTGKGAIKSFTIPVTMFPKMSMCNREWRKPCLLNHIITWVYPQQQLQRGCQETKIILILEFVTRIHSHIQFVVVTYYFILHNKNHFEQNVSFH